MPASLAPGQDHFSRRSGAPVQLREQINMKKKDAGKHSGKAAFVRREPLAVRLFVLTLFVVVVVCGGLLVPVLWTALSESTQCRTDGQACNFVQHPKSPHDLYK